MNPEVERHRRVRGAHSPTCIGSWVYWSATEPGEATCVPDDRREGEEPTSIIVQFHAEENVDLRAVNELDLISWRAKWR